MVEHAYRRFEGLIGPLPRTAIVVLALLAYVALAPWTIFAADGDPLNAVAGGLAPADVLTVAGASIVNAILMGALIAAWKPTSEQKDRFGPILALLVAVVVVVIFAAVQGGDLTSAFLTGILVGGGSMGVHDVVGSVQSPPSSGLQGGGDG